MASTAPNSSSQQINVSHLAQALSSYAKTSDVNSAVSTAVSSVTKWLTIRNGDGTTVYGTYNGTGAVTIDIPSGGSYSLPLAANGTRGGIQIGYTSSGKNYAVQLSNEKAYVNVPWEDHHDWDDITNKPNLMTTDTNQTASGVKTFSNGSKFMYLCVECTSNGTEDISYSGEINRFGGDVCLQYRTSTGNVLLCYGGGNVGIGNVTTPSYKLQVEGTTYLGGNTTVNGTVTAGSNIEIGGSEFINPSTCATIKTLNSRGLYLKAGASPYWMDGTWNNTSDIRKKNVVDYVDADLEMIAKARIFDFKWKADSKSQTMLGTAAQDWQKIFPNAVKDGPDGYLSMDYSATALAAAVITARKVVNHEKEIARLKKRIEDLEKQLAS
jgi:hypothetical protein